VISPNRLTVYKELGIGRIKAVLQKILELLGFIGDVISRLDPKQMSYSAASRSMSSQVPNAGSTSLCVSGEKPPVSVGGEERQYVNAADGIGTGAD